MRRPWRASLVEDVTVGLHVLSASTGAARFTDLTLEETEHCPATCIELPIDDNVPPTLLDDRRAPQLGHVAVDEDGQPAGGKSPSGWPGAFWYET